MTARAAHPPAAALLGIALVLSLGAALSLGLARFAYGLLLPPMRADLAWSYALAGGMNTANAAGYLLGALSTPWLLRRLPAGQVLMAGAVAATVLLAVGCLFVGTGAWLMLRLLVGITSALVFVTGGLLAARMGALDPARGGLLIGVYYGGTGLGISLSALVLPLVLEAAVDRPHAWTWGWAALAALCGLATVLLRWPVARLASLDGAPLAVGAAGRAPVPLRRMAYALAGYGMFGVGYIGYMTFVVALLREQGQSGLRVTVFFALLGVAVMVSPRLWARLLDRYRDGRPLALLNGLLGIATMLPVLGASWPLVLVSGLLFGAVFLSLVASTTALVRHNLAPAQWAGGIGAFTIVFAAGQIVGPTMVGWVSDGVGGLERGFLISAIALWTGSAIALRQRALPRSH